MSCRYFRLQEGWALAESTSPTQQPRQRMRDGVADLTCATTADEHRRRGSGRGAPIVYSGDHGAPGRRVEAVGGVQGESVDDVAEAA